MTEKKVNGEKKEKEKIEVSLIIPAYNEQESVKSLIEHIYEFLKKKELLNKWEVVFVDDGSKDDTLKILSKLLEKDYQGLQITIKRHQKNLGVTAALETGSRYAHGDILVFFPADLQFHLDDVERMISHMKEKGYDLITGKKRGKYEKKFVSKIYNKLSQILFGLPVSDMNSIKAFKKEIIDNIPLRKDWHRYIVPLAFYKGYRLDEVEVTLYPRTGGESKYKGLKRVIIGVFDLLAVKFQISFMRKPMLFFGSIGTISTVLGVLVGLIAIYMRVFKHHGYRPLIYLTMFLILAGLIIFTVGLLGEMIAGLYDLIEKKCKD